MSTVLSTSAAAAAKDALVAAAVASSSPAKDKTCSTRPCCSGIVFITTTTSSFFSVCDPANAFHLLCSPALPSPPLSPALIDPFRGKEHRQAHSFDRKTEGKKFGVHRSVSPAVVDSDTRYDSGTASSSGSHGDPSLLMVQPSPILMDIH